MSQRNYTNFAKTAAPASSIASGDTSIDVDTQTDYPDAPYVIVVFEGGDTPPAASKKEVMRVAAVSGSGPYTLTVERDIDGYNGGGESFTTSATVQHVSVADEVGPTRSRVQGVTGVGPQQVVYDDFAGSDGDLLDGRVAPSGQTWSDPDSNIWKINSDRAYADSNIPRQAKLSYIPTSNTYRVEALYETDSRQAGPIIAYQDDDNYLFVYVRSDYGIKMVSGGSVSLLASSGLTAPFTGIFRVSGGVDKREGYLWVGSEFGGLRFDLSNNADADSIVSNSVGVGLHDTQSKDPTSTFQSLTVIERGTEITT